MRCMHGLMIREGLRREDSANESRQWDECRKHAGQGRTDGRTDRQPARSMWLGHEVPSDTCWARYMSLSTLLSTEYGPLTATVNVRFLTMPIRAWLDTNVLGRCGSCGCTGKLGAHN